MFSGSITFTAPLEGTSTKFQSVEIDPHVPGVQKIILECPDGTRVDSAIHLSPVATREEGNVIAEKTNREMLDHLSFWRNIGIGHARKTGESFVELNAPAGTHLISGGINLHLTGHASFEVQIIPESVKAELEQPQAAHRHYGFYRAAMMSYGPVEQFMHLYNILLMLYADSQTAIDAFILAEEPGVPQTQHPMKRPGVMETVYTRLRNEFAHQRLNVNLDQTKWEMEARLSAFQTLASRPATPVARGTMRPPCGDCGVYPKHRPHVSAGPVSGVVASFICDRYAHPTSATIRSASFTFFSA